MDFLDLSAKSLKKNYGLSDLKSKDLSEDPFKQFEEWILAAKKMRIPEYNAMTLATADAEGKPSSRTLLLKKFDGEGFFFFTNYESRKAQQIKKNPYASILFWWGKLERQVSIEGKIEKIPQKESQTYFSTRSKESQLGSWASPQSSPINNRTILEKNFQKLEEEYKKKKKIPLPPFWGGFKLIPERFEFWQGRPNRLHDRFCYTFDKGIWTIQRLAP